MKYNSQPILLPESYVLPSMKYVTAGHGFMIRNWLDYEKWVLQTKNEVRPECLFEVDCEGLHYITITFTSFDLLL